MSTVKSLARFAVCVLLVLCLAALSSAEVRLPSLFSDHMVLQREMPLPVWGWALPGERVTVTLDGQTKSTTADAAGKWSLRLDAMKTAGPTTLHIEGNNKIDIQDVLVGEVWICSGQSNMQMAVSGSNNFDEEKAAANHPNIRMFTVERKPAAEPQAECNGSWQVCSPETVGRFSAAGYFFGRELNQKLNVPVGMVHTSWGGTPVQAWTSAEAHRAVPELASLLDNLKTTIANWNPEKAKTNYDKQMTAWKAAAAKAKAEGKTEKGRPQPPVDPNLSQHSPARLYNGMVAPLVPYAIRGAIWYQGESNAGSVQSAHLYGLQLKTMIANWRSVWQEGDFPFIYVQLPGFMAAQEKPSETGGWPVIREEFVKLLAMPNTGMAVTIDVGEANNIHPKDKQTVGKRLAQWALAKVYGKDVVACGPLYKSMQKSDGNITLQFDNTGGGLVAKGGKLKGFAIAGPDKNFVWADAKIVGHTVIVSSPDVKDPAAVRYAWANNPECNLSNQAGLPASPFRTDDWAE